MKQILIISFCLFLLSLADAQQSIDTSFYENGKIKSIISFSKNVREGEAKFFYENGNIKEERNYINGRIEGFVKIYNEAGLLKETINIENGRREGPTSLFNDSGVYVKDIFYEEGKKVVEAPSYEVALKENPLQQENFNKQNPPKVENKKNNSEIPLPPLEEDRISKDDPAFYLTVEVMPEPAGGMEAIYKKLIYPEYAKKKEIQGIVKIHAFIDEFGEVVQADVIESIGYGCDETARNTVYYTKFKPGLLKGKPVKVQTVIPIEFKLPNKEED